MASDLVVNCSSKQTLRDRPRPRVRNGISIRPSMPVMKFSNRPASGTFSQPSEGWLCDRRLTTKAGDRCQALAGGFRAAGRAYFLGVRNSRLPTRALFRRSSGGVFPVGREAYRYLCGETKSGKNSEDIDREVILIRGIPHALSLGHVPIGQTRDGAYASCSRRAVAAGSS
jgi:hypothetical protein